MIKFNSVELQKTFNEIKNAFISSTEEIDMISKDIKQLEDFLQKSFAPHLVSFLIDDCERIMWDPILKRIMYVDQTDESSRRPLIETKANIRKKAAAFLTPLLKEIAQRYKNGEKK
jgi:hypothetical protein